mmetsp:Transcript_15198/g.28578  ORF Transcript_15198/g.28578 Transcript_15198/m.28578 type:complete len:563 (+) Transcript_15198:137-1825(+)|eukprot:CAMPEP_0176493340 /NCGR_PEP_ID=MMETSP0200_2-20121128/9498_1 /TAXON_ID=947934 /ORGANISM="Chaetoceros sp., Strain GSL56" /LENGTH=562 /DNA_ID=CAMNT_0017890999 /DNA_START=99 /DNA_END=1787 /DNA_ORIENTATION=-
MTTVKKRRDPLSPKPILDRKLLCQALKERDVAIKDVHLDTFYQQLHRQNYPKLKEFVIEYLRTENARGGNLKENEDIGNQNSTIIIPTKNSVSSKKGRIRRLPKAFLDFLADPQNDFVTLTSTIDKRPTSTDGTTTKMAIKLQDGHVVESVLMRHVSAGGSRATLCVSSQVGCAMGCTFCATGTMGIRGNLCSGEILEQLVHAERVLQEEMQVFSNGAVVVVSSDHDEHDIDGENDHEYDDDMIVGSDGSKRKKSEQDLTFVRNVVFMGMGEPLNNFENVVVACRAMIDRRRWNLAHGRVTVSTVGVTPNMRRLTKELPEVSLALSLHAPNQPMREAIVPTARMYPIEDIVDALDEHMMALIKKTKSVDGEFDAIDRKSMSKRKRAMIEYVMLEGDTSKLECAHQLGKLCENRKFIVNLIPYNQTDVKDKLSCPSEEHMKEFQRIVMSYGAFCTIRRTMGADIAGACGQLVVSNEKKDHAVVQLGDIEDGPFVDKSSDVSQETAIPRQQIMSTKNVKEEEGKGDDRNANIEKWIKPLAVGTALSLSVCLLSMGVIAFQRRKR